MGTALTNLFNYAADRVTAQDIIDHSIKDPGYGNYMREMTRVLESRKLPTRREFDLTENINLNLHKTGYEERFCRFRVFACVIGVSIEFHDDDGPSNLLLLRLIQDVEVLKDMELLRLSLPVFLDLFAKLRAGPVNFRLVEYPFTLLAAVLTEAIFPNPDAALLAAWTSELINADSELSAIERYPMDDLRPILGLTNYDTYHDLWVNLIRTRLAKFKSPPIPEFLAAFN